MIGSNSIGDVDYNNEIFKVFLMRLCNNLGEFVLGNGDILERLGLFEIFLFRDENGSVTLLKVLFG